MKYQYCINPVCQKACKNNVPIRDMNRRLSVGNFYGEIVFDEKITNINKYKKYRSNNARYCNIS